MKSISNPKLSIITINYNNRDGLIQTIKSVINQTWQDFEYIVIDGGSTDGSRNLIIQNADNLSYWVSEGDQGIYHAMNKGIEASSGEYLLFLNSGDLLKDLAVLSQAVSFFSGKDIVYSNLELIDDKGSSIWCCPDKLSFKYFIHDTLPHCGSFIKRELFVKYGFYDEKLKICSDWKFFIETICKYNATYKHLHLVLACHFQNGISCMEESKPIVIKERKDCLASSFSAFISDYKEFDRINEEANKVHKAKIVKLLKKLRLL